MLKNIYILFIIISSGTVLLSQNSHKLICQKGKRIYIYNYSNNSFKEIAEIRKPSRIAIEQSGDTIYIYDDIYKYTYCLNLYSKNKQFYHLPFFKNFVPLVKNNKALKKDTLIHIRNNIPEITFSRYVDNYIVWARGGDIFYYNGKDTVKYLKHYVKMSMFVSYRSWGYVFPELSKDKKTLYFIDTYKFKYEEKHKLFNRRKNENIEKRRYGYLIAMNFQTKMIIKTIKIPFIQVGTVYTREFRNLQLSPDDKYLFFEAYPNSYLYDTKTDKIIKLPEGYFYITWIK